MQAVKITPQRSHFITGYRASLISSTKGGGISMGIRRITGSTCNRLLNKVEYSAGKGTSGLNKFGISVINRMNMKLGSKFLNLLGIKTQLLKGSSV